MSIRKKRRISPKGEKRRISLKREKRRVFNNGETMIHKHARVQLSYTSIPCAKVSPHTTPVGRGQ
jgi:hypothetical protein